MEKSWIEFDGTPARADRNKIYASLSQKGEFVINGHTFEQLDRPEAVVLLYEPNLDEIGIKPTTPLMPNAFTVKQKGVREHKVIRAAPFIRRHDIRLKGTVSFRTATVENGILVLRLREMDNVTRGPRGERYKKRRY